ncbi:ATP-binding protein [Donghicola sp. XS_ASV15]|uniref:ATP-binding protein n=1 Tax=Donghicola sp. XS_ASV15 TaxID=3241295 RepID=UPI003516ECF2
MATRQSARFTCEATALAVRHTLQEMTGRLADWAIPSDPRVELAVAEAMNNIVEHAYADNPSGRIQLDVSLIPQGLSVALSDRGLAMPDGAVPIGEMPAPETLPEGGWGWSLIHACCDGLHYERTKGANELTMVFQQVEI